MTNRLREGIGRCDVLCALTGEDTVFMTRRGVKRGKTGIREAFTELLADLPNARWELKTQIYEGDILLLEWAAVSHASSTDDGIDTIVFRDGLIRAQPVRYTPRKSDNEHPSAQ